MSRRVAQPVPRRRWAAVVAVAVAAAAAILFVATTPKPELPLPGDAVESADPAVQRLLDDRRERVRANPGSAAAWGELGLVLVAHGHASDGAACLARAADLDPADWRWPAFEAAVESDIDLERAAATVAEAIRRDPAQEWPRLWRARWLEQLGRPAEAEPLYESLSADTPGHALAGLGLARALAASDALDRAATALEPALRHEATRRAAHELLARIEGRRGDFAAATAAAAAARELPPDTNWPGDPLAPLLLERRPGKHELFARTLAAYEAGDESVARQLTADLVAGHPEVGLLLQGRRLLAAGDAAAAERSFRAATVLDPGWIESKFELGRALRALGRLGEAAAVLREVVAAEPSYPQAWEEIAACLDTADPAAAAAARGSAARYRAVGKASTSGDR
jgi:predicted Zn-dependent protease